MTKREDVFNKCIETGRDFKDYKTDKTYHFAEYSWMMKRNATVSGVYVTDKNGFICDIWTNSAVIAYVFRNKLKPEWLKKAS